MDSDASTLFGAILLAFLLIINFIMTAFLAAIRSISDSDLEEAFAAQGRPPDPVCELKDHPWRLTHTVWLLTAVTYTLAGYLITRASRQYPFYVVFPVLAVLMQPFHLRVDR